MITFQRHKYLVPDAVLFEKKVTIRFDMADISRIDVWHNDRYYGEARVYLPENDPIERKLAAYRQELASGQMLGNSHPTSDLTGYLEGIKIAALAGRRKKY